MPIDPILQDVLVDAVKVAVGAGTGGAVAWFVSSVRFGAKLDANAARVDARLAAEKAAADVRLQGLRTELLQELEKAHARIEQVARDASTFRETSNHDFAKEAAVARDMQEITELCQRLLHTVGILEGVLQQGGTDLGPGMGRPARLLPGPPQLPRPQAPRPRPPR